ncbi:hypothetical protein LTR36_006762 [Oleoguttula mirabilis]|uniref:Uncharacterized protein n=1 Tax=Oleoguttula mirabilis TaxID=1507867 RepID=A0AAV9JCK1_9PEZI|nr:hypothetical protein LTR36_006762 [Oleoguttula mirabilis]
MVVLPHPDPANDLASFRYGQGLTVGRFTGWPNVSPSGIMQGELAVAVPGLEEPLQGTWLSVRSTSEESPQQKAFDQLVNAVRAATEAPKPADMALEDMLAWVAEGMKNASRDNA